MDESQDQDIITHDNPVGSDLRPSANSAHSQYRRRLAYAEFPGNLLLPFASIPILPKVPEQPSSHTISSPAQPSNQATDGQTARDFSEDESNYLIASWGSTLSPIGFMDGTLWRSAVIEAVGIGLMTYVSGATATMAVKSGFFLPSLIVGLSHAFILSIFILATGPSSGGHINPLITLSTTMTKLCSLPRCILYLIAQIAGATVGGLLLNISISNEAEVEKTQLGACWFDPTLNSVTSVLVREIVFSWALVFLAFGVALDPRQQKIFGPVLGPIFVGLIVGIMIFVSGGISDGYPGAGMNPARCFGLAVATGDWQDHWVWWVGPFVGAACNSILYNLVPPYHRDFYEVRRLRRATGTDPKSV